MEWKTKEKLESLLLLPVLWHWSNPTLRFGTEAPYCRYNLPFLISSGGNSVMPWCQHWKVACDPQVGYVTSYCSLCTLVKPMPRPVQRAMAASHGWNNCSGGSFAGHIFLYIWWPTKWKTLVFGCRRKVWRSYIVPTNMTGKNLRHEHVPVHGHGHVWRTLCSVCATGARVAHPVPCNS